MDVVQQLLKGLAVTSKITLVPTNQELISWVMNDSTTLTHILESDNRLSWFLARLDERFPEDVFYVHLKREDDAVAKSYAKRFHPGLIMPAYADGIYIDLPRYFQTFAFDIAKDYVATVNSNIEFFLKEKPNKMTINLETIKQDFKAFWVAIFAEGDLDAALSEFDKKYNGSSGNLAIPEKPTINRALNKLKRIVAKSPGFLRNA